MPVGDCLQIAGKSNPIMQKSYFKIAFRSLWKNKTYSFMAIANPVKSLKTE
jgi:hypothetical protein